MADDSPILYLIRHGEKPPKQPDGEDGLGLSELGSRRAQGLVEVFGRDSPYNIGLIIAQEPKEDGKEDRPFLTVQPLANKLKPDVKFDHSIERDDVKKVAKKAKAFQGPGNVLICWEHDTLHKIAKAIGVENAPDYPGKRFDLIWTIKAPYDEIDSETSENVPGIDSPDAPVQLPPQLQE